MENQTQELIHKHMTIGDIVERYPQVVETLSSYGVHCVGCSVATWETIEQGFRGHGMSDQDIDEAVVELNRAAKKPITNTVPKGDGSNKITLTDSAAKKISDLLKQQNKESWGLRVKVVPGGCSGYSYNMQFEEKPNNNDVIVENNGVRLFVDKESINMLSGASVDYMETLQQSGFKIENPNAHSTCGCGKSFG